MTKRFTVDDGLEDVLCWEINDKENEDMTCGECAKLLNELHEENMNLRKEKECNKQVFTKKRLHELLQQTRKENEQLKLLIKKVLETTPIEHSLALDLKNSIRELYK